jgi:hypothetical protein
MMAPVVSMRPRLALAALVGLAALIAVALAIGVGHQKGGPSIGAPALRTRALPADAFVNSIGASVHFPYTDTAYARQSEVIARLRELGLRHIRDGMPLGRAPLIQGLTALRAAGIRATLVGEIDRDPNASVAESVAVMGGAIDAFEAPNELDNIAISRAPDWLAQLRAYMPALAAAARGQAPGVPVIGPSLIDSGNRDKLPRSLPGMFNGHPYSGGVQPEPALTQALLERQNTAPGRAAVFTEAGYHNALNATTGQAPVSEAAAAIYIPRLLMTAFGAGVKRTFIYELLDEKPDPGLIDPEQHFGLLRNDLSPKPAFTAVQTMIHAVEDSSGPVSSPHLGWRLEVDGGDEVKRLTLERRDGSRVIALWRPVPVWDIQERHPVDPGHVRVRLRFGGLGARDVRVWRPSVSTRPVLRRAHAGQLGLILGADLVLVSVR